MPIYTLTLKDKQLVATQTILFRFHKPDGFSFTPGQYGGFTLIQPKETDAKGNTRRFSLLSTPADPYLDIVTRLQTSTYKQTLNQFQIGDSIKFAGPMGQFILPQEGITTPVVLIAGGIGIAPFFSMIRHSIQYTPTRTIYLFYGNQSIESAAFYIELKKLSDTYPDFHFIPTLDQANSNWQGETGFITPTMLQKHLPDKLAYLYFVCGAPMMVAGIKETLLDMGIEETSIMVEDFQGIEVYPTH